MALNIITVLYVQSEMSNYSDKYFFFFTSFPSYPIYFQARSFSKKVPVKAYPAFYYTVGVIPCSVEMMTLLLC